MSQPKVFEFAKEIGMETLALMDKIREWKLPVRSHMAELAPELLEQIKTRLASPQDDESAGKKKKVTKKAATKAPAKETSGKTAGDSKTAAAKAPPAAKKVAKKTASKAPPKAAAEAEEAASKKAAVVKKSTAKIVVRRKADEEEVAPEVVAEPAIEEAAHEAPVVEAAPPVQQAKAEEVVAEKAPAKAALKAEVAASVEPAAAPAVQAAAPSEAAASTAAAAIAPGAAPEEGVTKVIPSVPSPSRKREVVMTSQGLVSGVRSEAPRRNIVGRMDLARVAPPAGTTFSPSGRPGMPSRPGGPASGPGSSTSRPGAGGLRTGFVAAAPVVMEEPNNFERRRFDDKKKKTGPGAAPSATGGVSAREKELEEQLASFSATEFRKREMVFQPKKKKGLLNRDAKRTVLTTPKASKRIVKINNTIRVADLAMDMGIKAAQLIKALMTQGVMATMNTELDFDTVALIVPELGFEAVNVFRTVDQLIDTASFGDKDAVRITRPPVVTVMGHVDHGKTSLLDAIRKADVAKGEAGGITQHIGAYQVTTEHGHSVTFIDTPGHEAFTAMRARGANATDIAIVVVAADDGVMPQTVEAINHAKAAGVPIIVAINKIDKPGANIERIKQQMTEYEIVPEEWGGTTIFAPVSAHTKAGISEMLEQIYLLAEVGELTANPARSATGVVIESRMDKNRGVVATLLVQDGTLRVGQPLVVGSIAGKVRSLVNDKGERVTEAGPSQPVEVLGLSEAPMAGDRFDAAEDDQSAQNIAAARKEGTAKAASAVSNTKLTLEDIFAKMKRGDLKELPIVLKTDMAGSAEAIKGMFEKLGTAEVKIKLIHSAIGGVNESDVLLASTAKGIVVGFNVRPDGGAQQMAKRENIEIKTYSIVYELMDDMKKAMSGLLAPEIVEKQLGRAEVRNTFSVPKLGMIGGCAVVDGKITRQSQLRLVRDGKIIYTGKVASLKRFKDDAREVAAGYECGIGIENFNDLKVGDVIEAYAQESITREL